MIAVIADDFTGAAELAGISLRFGLKVELCAGEVSTTNADVLVISTDSRSLKREQAISITKDVVKKILKLNPVLIYKKIDSVLRGYVLDELKVQMQLMQKEGALILPANPSLGRTISNGEYFVDGRRINETGFAADPEFPIRSSLVKSILNDELVSILKHTDILSGNGIVIGEAGSKDDTESWADKTGDSRVLAGAGDFYTALLGHRFKEQKQEVASLQLPYLYVCGTAYGQSVNRVKQIEKKLHAVMYINEQVISSSGADEPWLNTCSDILKLHRKAVIAFDQERLPASAQAEYLRNVMAKVVRQVIEKNVIKELFIEGGSTATAILRELSIHRLSPVDELRRGVVRMKADNLYVTVKPGSYELPDKIKELFNS